MINKHILQPETDIEDSVMANLIVITMTNFVFFISIIYVFYSIRERFLVPTAKFDFEVSQTSRSGCGPIGNEQSYTGNDIIIIIIIMAKREEKRSDVDMTNILGRQTMRSQSNTKKLQKRSITHRVRTDLGRSVRATTVVQSPIG